MTTTLVIGLITFMVIFIAIWFIALVVLIDGVTDHLPDDDIWCEECNNRKY